MASHHNRHNTPLLVRTMVLVVALAAAPVGRAASAPGPDGRTSADVADELEQAKADQAQLAAAVAEQQRAAAELAAVQDGLRADIDETAAALDATNADLTAVRQQIVQMVDRIEQVKARYAHLVAELEELDVQLADLVEREAAKRLELRERQALLVDRIRAANDADRTSLLEVFLSAGSFSDVLAEVSYYLDIGAQDKALADRIVRDRETLATLHATIDATRTQTNVVRQQTAVQKKKLDAELLVLEATRERLAELEAQLASELAADTAAFEELAATRTDLEGDIAQGQAAQAELAAAIEALVEEEARLAEEERRRAEEERRRAEEERRRAEEAARLAEEQGQAAAEAIRLGNIPSEYNSTFIWPLAGRVTGEWGCSLYPGYGPGGPGCLHYHNGIDIARSCGSPIVAAGDGTVAYVGWNWADGPNPAWMVVIVHSTELKTWYAHMTPEAPDGISIGAKVTAGQVIGYEGSTGRSTGCHLHWMVELNGSFVNGRLFL